MRITAKNELVHGIAPIEYPQIVKFITLEQLEKALLSETTESRNYLYSIWRHMRRRCYWPDEVAYKNYGGRGIGVCSRWTEGSLFLLPFGMLFYLDGYRTFFIDMGDRPSPEHTLDRRDYDGHYTPENCRWATSEEQNNNRRNSILVTVDGITASIPQHARRVGISRHTVVDRIKRRGLSPSDALKKGRVKYVYQ